MTAERWQQVKELFNAARERAPAERAALLDAACADDEDLRREVVALLAAHEESGEFMQRPLVAAGKEAAPTAELPVGQALGAYLIERRLGAGGMGVVYLARDTRLGRLVALKLLQARFTQDAARVRRFQQEARAASALNHPGILTIHEIGQSDDAHFIVAEFVDGQTLRAQLKSGGMQLNQALGLLIQVANALAAAHSAGIVHRDIKPENIMLRGDGLAKVLDFGLAKLSEQAAPAAEFARVTTQPGVVMGTISYMSPEQARGLEVDARSDLFSLGVVMYELFTGHPPFTGETMSDVMVALLNGEPRPLARYVSALPAALQEIVNRALAKPRAQRYQTARELGADLQRLKEEWEFAARLQGRTTGEDPVLTMMVGAATDADAETTYSTHASHAARAAPTSGALVTNLYPAQPRRWGERAWLAAALLLLIIVGVMWGRRWFAWRPAATETIDSVAVLPFANMSNDAQAEYLSDGLTESLIGSLSQQPGLQRVMARSIVFTYKGRQIDPREVGAALNVRAVVIGRVEQRGQTLIVAAEVVKAADGARLWGARYERPLADLVTMQEQLARDLGTALRPRADNSRQGRPDKHYTDNSEAYQLYLRGRHLFYQGTRASLEKALEHFRHAISLDPRFAVAYTGIADIYAEFSGQHLAPSEAMPLARQAALTAIALDETLAEAHLSLAVVKWWGDWDWAGAEREFKRAIELNPNLNRAHESYSAFLIDQARFAEAIAEARRTLELDPLSRALGSVLAQARQYDAAIEQNRRTLELNPNHVPTLLAQGVALSRKELHEEAIATLRQVVALAPNDRHFSYLAYAYARGGQPSEARKILRELTAATARRRVSPVYLARVHIALGEPEPALAQLRQAYEEHSDHVLSLRVDPTYDPLRNDPRFAELLRGIGLTP